MPDPLVATRGRALAAAATLLACASLAGCIPSSFVQVDHLDLRTAYVAYSDSVLSSGRLSQPTRQTLNLVPEAQEGTNLPVALAALAASTRIDADARAFARSELLLREAEAALAQDPVRARRLHLAAAHEAARLLFPDGRVVRIDPFDRRARLATAFYGLASGRYFLALLRPEVRYTGVLVEDTPIGPFRVTFEPDDSSLVAYFFQDFEIAWGERVRGLRNRHTRDGIGIPLIARRAPGHASPIDAYLPPGGYIAPITMYLRFDPAASAAPERVRIGLVDARTTTHVCFGSQPLPVAADLTAPYARQIVQDRSRAAGRAALFGRVVPGSRFGVTISAPWDRAKIPLVMVHGLASSAESWRELTNDVLGSDELRGRYQIIHYTYPTSEPVLAAAARFRRELAAFLDSVGYDPAVDPKLVVVGHSMGGLLAKTLVVDSGNVIWDRVFTVAPEHIAASPESRRRFEDALILRPWPAVGRVIFLGTPHRGSEVADGWLGWFGRQLIRLPGDFVSLLRDVAQRDPEQLRANVRGWFERGQLTSVQSLSPTYPAMAGLASLPIVAGVPYHSVIGASTRDARGRPSDGYVTVESAHLEGATSELVLPIAHAKFDRAAPLNEVYRILREHAADIDMPAETTAGPADCSRG